MADALRACEDELQLLLPAPAGALPGSSAHWAAIFKAIGDANPPTLISAEYCATVKSALVARLKAQQAVPAAGARRVAIGGTIGAALIGAGIGLYLGLWSR